MPNCRTGLTLLLSAALLSACSQTPVTLEPQATSEFGVGLVEPDAELADDLCDADPGPAVRCTLRAALMQANVTPGEHIVRLRPVLYRLTVPGANEDQAETGDLDLVGRITVIDATGLNDRVFDARSSSSRLENLVITGGTLPTTTGNSTKLDGGGVRAFGTFTLLDSVVRNNTASRGGGVAVFQGKATILRSTIRGNSATAGDTTLVADGGGVFSINNTFTLRDSAVENNTSAHNGGGITLAPIFSPSTPMMIERTLIAGNSAQHDGGGVFVTGSNGGSAVVENTTVSGNRSFRLGGGVSTEQLPFDKPLVLRALTVAGNKAPGFGGGLVEATNVIFSNNPGGNCFVSRFENSTFNLSSDSFCGFSSSDNNQNNVSAKLGPLAFNGGPTRTHALLPGSPVINAGVSFAPVAFDQRGEIRLAEFRPFGNRFDIGAFESNPFVPPQSE